MSPVIYAILIIVPMLALMISAFLTFKKRMEGKPVKKVMRLNVAAFLVLIVMVGIFTFAASATSDAAQPVAETQAEAADAEAPAAEETSASAKGMGLLAAAIVTSLAGIGGGIAVAAGAPAAIAATSEDPKSFGKSLIFVALGESIALYGVIISILILLVLLPEQSIHLEFLYLQ